jgi:hypothetical protein
VNWCALIALLRVFALVNRLTNADGTSIRSNLFKNLRHLRLHEPNNHLGECQSNRYPTLPPDNAMFCAGRLEHFLPRVMFALKSTGDDSTR